MQLCVCAIMRLCDYAIVQLCDCAIMRLCDYAIVNLFFINSYILMLRPIKPIRGELAHAVRQLYFADRVRQNLITHPVQTLPGTSTPVRDPDSTHEHSRDIPSPHVNPQVNPQVDTPTYEQLLTLTQPQRNRIAEMQLRMDEVVRRYKKIRGCERAPRVITPTVYEPFTDATCRCGKPSTIILFPCEHKSSCADCYRVLGHCPKCSAAYTMVIK